MLFDAYRACSWPASAMRSAACFMQIEMDDIEAHVAGTSDAQYRVGIRAIVVKLSTGLMYHHRYLRDIAIEEAERVGVGHHNRRDICRVGVQQGTQMLHINAACLRVALDLDRFIIGKCRAGGVGAVCVVGNQHEIAMSLTLALVLGLDEHQSRQFTVRTSRRL